MSCPFDNPNCPAPSAPAGQGHHAACADAEADRYATEQRALKRLEREFAEAMAEPIPRQLRGRGVELAYRIAALRKRVM